MSHLYIFQHRKDDAQSVMNAASKYGSPMWAKPMWSCERFGRYNADGTITPCFGQSCVRIEVSKIIGRAVRSLLEPSNGHTILGEGFDMFEEFGAPPGWWAVMVN